MDTLALLCTMHADGPASIQRLRAADLASIDDVLGCSVETTAEVLGLSMAQGRRFHREARMLAMRTQGEGLDREESMYPGGVAAELAAAQAVMQSVAATAKSVEPMSSTQDFRDSQKSKPDIAAILAPVLKRWEKDDVSEREAQQEAMGGAGAMNTASSAPTSSISVASLDGVDGELSKALIAAGYGTLEAINGVEPLALSRAINRPYSEACRVLFLAKRAQASSPAAPGTGATTPSEGVESLSDDGRFGVASGGPGTEDTSQVRGAASEGPGGPFA